VFLAKKTLMERLRALPLADQAALVEDIICAFEKRLEVFEKEQERQKKLQKERTGRWKERTDEKLFINQI
jgi:hypothetical protein